MNKFRTIAIAMFSMIIMFTACNNGNNAGKDRQTNIENQNEDITQNSSDTPNAAFSKPEQLNKKQFLEKVFNYEQNQQWAFIGQEPCVIDFYADWCRPCKQIAPIIDKLAKKHAGQVRFYKVNTDYEPDLAAYFGINSIPSIMFCPMSGAPEMHTGAMPEAEFVKIINRLFAEQIAAK